MKTVAQLTPAERSELFTETASTKGITAAAAEKDFWICWALMHIFEHPKLSKVLRFKGGTTLSKCFGLIERFSEDIDLILDWTTVVAEDPQAERSKTKQQKLNKSINEEAQAFIRQYILPELQGTMNNTCRLEIDNNDPHTINIKYPSVYPTSGYLRNEIRLEIGSLASMLPYGQYPVKSYAAESFPAVFQNPAITVDAIVPQRTFWEKVTILHAEAHRPDNSSQPARYSRHYYDVHQMLHSEVKDIALDEINMLPQVVAFKQKFYPSGWANYDKATSATIKLLPGDRVQSSLAQDYTAMREMIFGEYPPFTSILKSIAAFQQQLNELEKGD